MIRHVGVVAVAGGGVAATLEHRLEDTIAECASKGWNFTGLLSCGIAGALDPALRAGDVVIGDLFSGESRSPEAPNTATATLDPGLRRGTALVEWLARHLPEAHRGTVIGANTIIASTAEKTAFHATTGALAVDMESHIAARVAARHGLPFAILRTISDTADHALPPAALVGMKPDGGMALGAVLASLARDPAQLPALIRTGRDAGAAFARLGRALRTLEAVGIGELDLLQLGLDMG